MILSKICSTELEIGHIHSFIFCQPPLLDRRSRDEELEAIYNWDVQNFLAIRAYYHDRVASAHIASHRQPVVVELGAGMSTHFHQIGSKVSRWFDLDLPVVTDLRRQLDSL
ncbi:MAG: hypothetical protein GDA48_11135 [Hormoscilla sp. GM102CHS1]|nr:hypothetical protein [Hormoscilla sp. GM102CHS1]